jgi:hypothetical protein
MQGIEAIAIFLAVVFIWRTVFVKDGNFRFWQLAANQPEAAREWMEGRSDWTILHPDNPEVEQLKKDTDLVGPFILAIPSLGGKVVIFAESSSLEESQSDFIESFGGNREFTGFPWLSSITMLYPISAMVTIANMGAPILPTLGYGFANLGYLLLGAGILAGGFRALGFRYRGQTIIAAIAIWIMGTALSNL